MKKFFLILMMLMSVWIPHVFAETVEAGCNLYAESDSAITDQSFSAFTSIYPAKLLAVAQKNHKNYCCRDYNMKISAEVENYCNNNATDTYVTSPWLFDHLIDVGFRYLDGVEDLQYEWAPLDNKGKERREKITVYGTNPNGSIPLAIMNDYTTYWWDRNKDLNMVQSATQNCTDSKERLSEYNTQRDSLSLVQKYFAICELSACLVGNNDQKSAFFSKCQQLSFQRIVQEDEYVQAVIIHQGQQAIATNFNAYARGYMNHNRLDALLEKIVMMAKGIGFVDSKVPEMTRMCSA